MSRTTLTEVGKEAETLRSALQKASNAAEDTASYLELSRVLVTQLEALVALVADHRDAA